MSYGLPRANALEPTYRSRGWNQSLAKADLNLVSGTLPVHLPPSRLYAMGPAQVTLRTQATNMPRYVPSQ